MTQYEALQTISKMVPHLPAYASSFGVVAILWMSEPSLPVSSGAAHKSEADLAEHEPAVLDFAYPVSNLPAG